MRSMPFTVIWKTATGQLVRQFDNAGETLEFYRQHRNDPDKIDMTVEDKQQRHLSEEELERLAASGSSHA